MENKIKEMMAEEIEKAWRALAGYKFYMFGYHAACWVKLNKLLETPLANPFSGLVDMAKRTHVSGIHSWQE